MKILFKLLSGNEITLDGVDGNTSLREIKKFFEIDTQLKRDQYFFVINRTKGYVNDYTLSTFSNYLKSVHKMDLDEKTEVIVINVKLNLASGPRNSYRIRTDLDPQLADKHPILQCGITHKLITEQPVKVNGVFYDLTTICQFMDNERNNYISSGGTCMPLCPQKKQLPLNLQKAMKLNYLHLELMNMGVDSLEEYEDHLNYAQHKMNSNINSEKIKEEYLPNPPIKVSKQVSDFGIFKPEVISSTTPFLCSILS